MKQIAHFSTLIKPCFIIIIKYYKIIFIYFYFTINFFSSLEVRVIRILQYCIFNIETAMQTHVPLELENYIYIAMPGGFRWLIFVFG